ncbi:GNAT family N-acetyltransferase [Streptomyces sp. NRRL S-87]|uniref:GNAT family N-acetyltransferase n=1 Tax=Streptomyces sp. NRRL S-87 TaxID=1463920 RepID=UPI0004C03770|nr:GNAT family protein [Streptomyces sp. NRRL S-87]
MGISVRLEAWGEEDFWLLLRKNEPAMTAYLGGPESDAKLADRHRRYLALSAGDPTAGRMFRVRATGLDPAGAVTVGTIGFWGRTWRGEEVYETGWGVLPEHQGHGLAALAARALITHLRTPAAPGPDAPGTEPSAGAAPGTAAARMRRHLHAYPSTDHHASNAVCRRAGFTLLGQAEFEYPPGHWHTSNDWCVDLAATPPGP